MSSQWGAAVDSETIGQSYGGCGRAPDPNAPGSVGKESAGVPLLLRVSCDVLKRLAQLERAYGLLLMYTLGFLLNILGQTV